MKTLICVAKFREDIAWVRELQHTDRSIVVYDKESTYKNVGREAETFLRCICDIYDALQTRRFDQVVFLQGNPFDHVSMHEIQTKLSASNGVTPLGKVVECDKNGMPHHPGLPVERGWMIVQECTETSMPRQEWRFSAGAQYIVPAQSITKWSRDVWLRLHREVERGTICPWSMERYWMHLFE
jgi:hypothetical protein